MSLKKIVLCLIVLGLIAAFFGFDLHHYSDISTIQSTKAQITDYYHDHPIYTGLLFFGAYVLITGLSLPGAAIMSLIAGAMFGIVYGTIMTSFASVSGACIAFLTSRYLFQQTVQQHFAKPLQAINEGMKHEGVWYLLTLRLIPIFPFFMINILMGLTWIKITTFAWVSQLGMLPSTIVLVNAGKQLSSIRSIKDVLSPQIFIALILLGLTPITIKMILKLVRKNTAKQNS